MNKELLFSVTKKDFNISYFSGTGAGGQHRNKHQNCVRISHPDSGASAVGQDERSKEQNLKNAFTRLVNGDKFQKWLKIRIAESLVDKEKEKQEIMDKVNKMMDEKYMKIEYYMPEDVKECH
jgi:protein subunit release factor A